MQTFKWAPYKIFRKTTKRSPSVQCQCAVAHMRQIMLFSVFRVLEGFVGQGTAAEGVHGLGNAASGVYRPGNGSYFQYFAYMIGERCSGIAVKAANAPTESSAPSHFEGQFFWCGSVGANQPECTAT